MTAARLSHVWFSVIFIVLSTSDWTYYISLKSAYIEDYSYGHERSTGGCFGTLYQTYSVRLVQRTHISRTRQRLPSPGRGHFRSRGSDGPDATVAYTREQLIALRGVRTLTNDVIAAAHPLRRQRGRRAGRLARSKQSRRASCVVIHAEHVVQSAWILF